MLYVLTWPSEFLWLAPPSVSRTSRSSSNSLSCRSNRLSVAPTYHEIFNCRNHPLQRSGDGELWASQWSHGIHGKRAEGNWVFWAFWFFLLLIFYFLKFFNYKKRLKFSLLSFFNFKIFTEVSQVNRKNRGFNDKKNDEGTNCQFG